MILVLSQNKSSKVTLHRCKAILELQRKITERGLPVEVLVLGLALGGSMRENSCKYAKVRTKLDLGAKGRSKIQVDYKLVSFR